MHIYNTKFEMASPMPVKVSIPNYSTGKIAVDIRKNGVQQQYKLNEVTLESGNTVLSADGRINGAYTIPVSIGDENDDKQYKVQIRKDYDYSKSKTYTMPSTSNVSLSVDEGAVLDPNGWYKYTGRLIQNVLYYDTSNIPVAVTTVNGVKKWRVKETGEYLDYYTVPEGGIAFLFGVTTDRATPFNQASVTITVFLGYQFSTSFDLTVESLKSEIYNKDPLKTVNLSGEYEDGTEFNLNVFVAD